MMTDDLTVITVCRNADATIADTLRSMAQQKVAGVEYVIVDGASTDATLALIQAQGPLVDILVSEADSGLYNAMNKGAMLARGRYVCYLNADDAYLPGAIASLLHHIRSRPDVGVFYGDWIGIAPDGCSVQRQANIELGARYRLCHQAMAVRRDLLGAKPFDERYRICADFDAILGWLGSGVRTVHIPLSLVRFSEGGISNTAVQRACRESIAIATSRLGLRRSWRFCLMTALHGVRVGAAGFVANIARSLGHAQR